MSVNFAREAFLSLSLHGSQEDPQSLLTDRRRPCKAYYAVVQADGDYLSGFTSVAIWKLVLYFPFFSGRKIGAR